MASSACAWKSTNKNRRPSRVLCRGFRVWISIPISRRRSRSLAGACSSKMHIADAGHNDGELPHAPEMQLAVREAGIVAISFVAMASPCEVLLETDDLRAADTLGRIAAR